MFSNIRTAYKDSTAELQECCKVPNECYLVLDSSTEYALNRIYLQSCTDEGSDPPVLDDEFGPFFPACFILPFSDCAAAETERKERVACHWFHPAHVLTQLNSQPFSEKTDFHNTSEK